jgi:hypothetical protein
VDRVGHARFFACLAIQQRRQSPNMNPDPITGRYLFVDGIVRPVFTDDGAHEYVINDNRHPQ